MEPLAENVILELLAQYLLTDVIYVLAKRTHGRSVYRVNARDGSYVLEIFADISVEDLITRIGLSNYLGRRLGVGDETVPTSSRSWFASDDKGHFALLRRSVSGVRREPFMLHDLEKIGEALGNLHNVKLPSFPIYRYVSPFKVWRDSWDNVSGYIADLFKEVEVIEESEFFVASDYVGLITKNLDLGSIVIKADSGVVFENMAEMVQVGPILLDQMNVFNKLKNLNPDVMPIDVFDALKNGYTKVRPGQWLEEPVLGQVRSYCDAMELHNAKLR